MLRIVRTLAASVRASAFQLPISAFPFPYPFLRLNQFSTLLTKSSLIPKAPLIFV